MSDLPTFINGDTHKDERGTLSFINDFKMDQVVRLYAIEHHDLNTVRAWQGHKNEQKWFYVTAGSFKIVLVKPDNWESPSHDLEFTQYILEANRSGVLHIPGGYANGFKALETGSKLLVFSNYTIDQSSGDNYRFDHNLWYNWVS